MSETWILQHNAVITVTALLFRLSRLLETVKDASVKRALRPEILSGWKDIANHLGKGVRTVQRYEHELRLPIHRPAGKARGAVITTTAELDSWVNASPLRESFALRRELPKSVPVLENLSAAVAEHRRLRKEIARLRVGIRDEMERLREKLKVISCHTDAPTSRSCDLIPLPEHRQWSPAIPPVPALSLTAVSAEPRIQCTGQDCC
jgi:hypothetical protein